MKKLLSLFTAAMLLMAAMSGCSSSDPDLREPDDDGEGAFTVVYVDPEEEDCGYCEVCDWCLDVEKPPETSESAQSRNSRPDMLITTPTEPGFESYNLEHLRGKKITVAWGGGTYLGNDGNDPDGRKAARQAVINAIDAEYGCEFTPRDIPGGAFALLEAAGPIIHSGSFFADIMVSYVHRIGSAVDMQIWRDLNKIPQMQMDSPIWDQRMTEQTRVFDKNLFVFPDFKSPAYTAAALMFNKRILDEVGMTSDQLYQMVRDKKWTFKEMQTLSARAYKNIDGVPGPSVGDQFGFVGVDMQGGVFKHVYIAAGGEPVVRTSDGGFRNNMDARINISALTTAASWLTSDKSVMNENIDQRMWERQTNAFMEGRALFYLTEAYRLPDASYSATDGCGMVPFPMNKEGGEYKSGINHNTEVIALPANNSNESAALAGMWLNLWAEGYSHIFAADLATQVSKITDPDAAAIREMNELIKTTGDMNPMYWGVISPGGIMLRLYRREGMDIAQEVKSINFDLQVNNFLAAVRAAR